MRSLNLCTLHKVIHTGAQLDIGSALEKQALGLQQKIIRLNVT